MMSEPFGKVSKFHRVKSKFVICNRSNAGAFVLTRHSKMLCRTARTTIFIDYTTANEGSVGLWNAGITPALINNSHHLQNYR